MSKTRVLMMVSMIMGALSLATLAHANDWGVGSSAMVSESGFMFTGAQVVRWIDNGQVAVGRWDDSLSIFKVLPSGQFELISTLSPPANSGVQMVTVLAPHVLASSNDAGSLALWRKNGPRWTLWKTLAHPKALGIANSGTVVTNNGLRFLLVGHANGFVSLWQIGGPKGAVVLMKTVDIRSPNPVPSPYPVRNVYDLEHLGAGLVVAASDDGDVVGINVPSGDLAFRKRYNPAAKRGVNSIALRDGLLLLANCSVGSSDSNLWLYRVTATGLELLDAKNLKIDTGLPQVFNFSVEIADLNGRKYFFASTQEGIVWVGEIRGEKLDSATSIPVGSVGGAALAYNPSNRRLLAVGNDLRLFELNVAQ